MGGDGGRTGGDGRSELFDGSCWTSSRRIRLRRMLDGRAWRWDGGGSRG